MDFILGLSLSDTLVVALLFVISSVTALLLATAFCATTKPLDKAITKFFDVEPSGRNFIAGLCAAALLFLLCSGIVLVASDAAMKRTPEIIDALYPYWITLFVVLGFALNALPHRPNVQENNQWLW